MRILIIEDREDYREVAAATLGGSHELVFATNYSDALAAMRQGGWGGVISDLFFPATSEEDLGPNGERLVAFLEKTAADPRFTGRISERTFAECGERFAPLGLQVITQIRCLCEVTPLVILSQGDRHEGALGLVRYALDHHKLDLIPLFVRGGVRCDKTTPQAWQEAIAMLDPKVQLGIWRRMWELSQQVYVAGDEIARALTYYLKK